VSSEVNRAEDYESRRCAMFVSQASRDLDSLDRIIWHQMWINAG